MMTIASASVSASVSAGIFICSKGSRSTTRLRYLLPFPLRNIITNTNTCSNAIAIKNIQNTSINNSTKIKIIGTSRPICNTTRNASINICNTNRISNSLSISISRPTCSSSKVRRQQFHRSQYNQHNQHNNHESSSSSSFSSNVNHNHFLLTLSTRIITSFGILHLLSEYCFEMTKCEGPSMMPTIQPNGEIILIEKISHRIHGLQLGTTGTGTGTGDDFNVNVNVNADNAEFRTKYNRDKQSQWEKKESKMWLAADKKKHRPSIHEHTWYEPKLKEASKYNYKYLSSWRNCYQKITTGICVGDVVVLQHPDRDGTVCKRVLGLPGDIIVRPKSSNSSSHQYYIGRGDRKHREVMDIFQSEQNGFTRKDYYRSVSSLTNSSLSIVPNGHIWIEGDNSINSSDSRNYGPVPASLVVGKVLMRLWPLRGQSIMVRGSTPLPASGVPFSGSTRLPAGYEGESLDEN